MLIMLLVVSGGPAVLAESAAQQALLDQLRLQQDVVPGDDTDLLDVPTDGVWHDQPLPEEPVVVEQDAFSQTELNPDGSYTTTFATRPMAWFDESVEEWKPFDNTLIPAGETDSAAVYGNDPAKNPYALTFASPAALAAGEQGLTLTAGETSLAMVPLGASPQTVTAEGSQLTYVEAFPGVDLR
jgi:hypothetical protein